MFLIGWLVCYSLTMRNVNYDFRLNRVDFAVRYSLTMRNVNLLDTAKANMGVVMLFINYEECKLVVKSGLLP